MDCFNAESHFIGILFCLYIFLMQTTTTTTAATTLLLLHVLLVLQFLLDFHKTSKK